MEKISALEKRDQNMSMTRNFGNNESTLDDKGRHSVNYDENPGLENTININNKTMISKFKYSEYGKENSSILNITEVVEENDNLKEKYDKIARLRERLRTFKKENGYLSSKMNDINTDIFVLTKLFTEGTHEISKELLKIHEIQLDKIVTSKS